MLQYAAWYGIYHFLTNKCGKISTENNVFAAICVQYIDIAYCNLNIVYYGVLYKYIILVRYMLHLNE